MFNIDVFICDCCSYVAEIGVRLSSIAEISAQMISLEKDIGTTIGIGKITEETKKTDIDQ
jgi:hypothetical protein